jgi:hypothetical protein
MSARTPGRWADPDWQRAALAWAQRELGGSRVRAWSQPHLRPWSTVLALDTDAGRWWLKAPGDGARFELGLLELFAELDVPAAPHPAAVDHELGLALLRDGGPTMRAAHGGKAPPHVVADYLHHYAGIQRALEPQIDRLLATGCADLRPARMPATYLATIDRLAAERPPGRLDIADAERLRAVAPAYAEACAELAASGIPATLNHDDLHDNNVLATGPVVIDWGDACVGHPFGTMLATLNSVRAHHGLDAGDPVFWGIVDAYTEAWTDLADRPTLRRQVQLCQRVGPLTRSLSYRQAVTGVDEAAWQEDADAMPGWLLEVLEPDLPTHPPLLT